MESWGGVAATCRTGGMGRGVVSGLWSRRRLLSQAAAGVFLGAAGAAVAACDARETPAAGPNRQPVTLDFLSHGDQVDVDGFMKDVEAYRGSGNGHVMVTSQLVAYDQLRQKTGAAGAGGCHPGKPTPHALPATGNLRREVEVEHAAR